MSSRFQTIEFNPFSDSSFPSLDWICRSPTGHLLELDFNKYNGNCYWRFPLHDETFAIASDAFSWLEKSGFFEDFKYHRETFDLFSIPRF